MHKKQPPKLQKIKRPLTKRRLKNDYANYKRAFKKSIIRQPNKRNNGKLSFNKSIGVIILVIICIFLFFAFLCNEFYHKQTFNHTVWLPFFYGMCCILFQIYYYIKHKQLPNLDNLNNKNNLWSKIQIVLLNLMLIPFIGYILGTSSNTLYTQIAGTYQNQHMVTIVDKNISKGRYDYYNIYVIDELNNKKELSLSYGFYNRVTIGNTLIMNEKCSVLSCYVSEDDIVIITTDLNKTSL